MKDEMDVLGSPSLIVLTVSGCKATLNLNRSTHKAQELCESRGGRPGLPVPDSPYGLCGRKATLNLKGRDIPKRLDRCKRIAFALIGRSLPLPKRLDRCKRVAFALIGRSLSLPKRLDRCMRVSLALNGWSLPKRLPHAVRWTQRDGRYLKKQRLDRSEATFVRLNEPVNV